MKHLYMFAIDMKMVYSDGDDANFGYICFEMTNTIDFSQFEFYYIKIRTLFGLTILFIALATLFI